MKLLVVITLSFLSTFNYAQQWNKVISDVRAIAIDSKDNMFWAATYNNGVYSYDRSTQIWKHYSNESGQFVTNAMNDIKIAANKVWVASNYGIYYCNLDGTNWKHYVLPGGYFPNWVRSIGDDENFVWFGTFQGIASYNKITNQFRTFNITQSNNSLTNNITAIAIDENFVWFGSEDGVQKYSKGSEITHDSSRIYYGKHNGFDNLSQRISITAIAPEDSNVWFGLEDYTPAANPTYCVGGLYRFDNNAEWVRFDQSDGLTGNGIHFIKINNDTLTAGLYSFIDGVNYNGKGLLKIDIPDLSITIYDSIGSGITNKNYFSIENYEDGTWLAAGNGIYTTAENVPHYTPLYPPQKPDGFYLKTISSTEVEIHVNPVQNSEKYIAYLSTNGYGFTQNFELHNNIDTIRGLESNQLYYFKVAAANSSGASSTTELLAVVTSDNFNSILIVNGFDRTSGTVNPGNYIIKHAGVMFENELSFNSASNEAIYTEIIPLQDYEMVNWFLGNESIANQTFSTSEQTLVKSFLENGGNLFVSGSEIGYDLVQNGTTASKSFYNNYLKATYIKDAAGGQGGVYSAAPVDESIFAGLDPFSFDNGTYGTFNVAWPDGILPFGSSKLSLEFENFNPLINGGAGIEYKGLFGNSSVEGKVLYLSIPFETIYPDEARSLLMQRIITFFDAAVGIENKDIIPTEFILYQNYPNPFNPVTKIKFTIPQTHNSHHGGVRGSLITIKVYDILGNKVTTLINEIKEPGTYEVEFDASSLSSGVYFYTLHTGEFISSKKMILLK